MWRGDRLGVLFTSIFSLMVPADVKRYQAIDTLTIMTIPNWSQPLAVITL